MMVQGSIPSRPTPQLLDISGLSLRFGNVTALENVSLTIDHGEIVGIAGESGSGKSTLCRCVMGLQPAAASLSGDVRLEGRPILSLDEGARSAIRGRDMAMIFQNPASHLNPLQRVGSQVAQPMVRHLGISRSEALERAIKLLDDVGIKDPRLRARSYPHQLSGGMKQRVMIAAAISCSPKLLIADEPTTALDVTVQARILSLLKSFHRERNLAIALVSHDLGVLADICSRIIVMRRGEIVEQGPVATIIDNPQHEYTRLLINSQPGRKKLVGGWNGEARAPMLLVKDLSVEYVQKRDLFDFVQRRAVEPFRALDGIDITVEAGATVGIVGESGSGKTTLARAIIRQVIPTSGTITLDGRDTSALDRAGLAAFRRRVQMIFQNPYDSLNPRMTAIETIAEPIWRHGLMDRAAAMAEATELLDMVELPRGLGERRPRQLSGGQCQRVGIARALALKPDLLIADEITSALDVTTQAQILELLARLQRARNLTLLYISHDLAVVRSFCQRVYVFKDGRIVESGTTNETFARPKQAYTRELISSSFGLAQQPASSEQRL